MDSVYSKFSFFIFTCNRVFLQTATICNNSNMSQIHKELLYIKHQWVLPFSFQIYAHIFVVLLPLAILAMVMCLLKEISNIHEYRRAAAEGNFDAC